MNQSIISFWLFLREGGREEGEGRRGDWVIEESGFIVGLLGTPFPTLLLFFGFIAIGMDFFLMDKI